MSAIPGYSVTVNLEALEEALSIPAEKLKEAFLDGRVASRFVELWAESLFGVKKHQNTNHKSSDAYFEAADNDRIEYAIRTLTQHGIRFQDSKFMGVGRKCRMEDLRESIRNSDRWLIFDIRGFPVITGYRIRCATLESWIDRGDLTPSGLSADRFCDLLSSESRPVTRMFDF